MALAIAFPTCSLTDGGERRLFWYVPIPIMAPFSWLTLDPKLSGFFGAVTNNLATLLIKASILVFYLRFSTSRQFTIAVYLILIVVITGNSLGALGAFFVCRPIQRFWNLNVDGTC